jgi:hypothetical protein
VTATADTATLVEAQAKALAAAQQAQAVAAAASVKLAAAEAAIEAQRRTRYLDWCKHVVASRRDMEAAAIQRIFAARTAFTDSVAAGDLNTALQRFLDWAEAGGAQAGLWRKTAHALSQVDPSGHISELSYRHMPGSFVDELSRAVAQAAATRNADADDAAQAEIAAAIQGQVVIDAPEAPPHPRKGA